MSSAPVAPFAPARRASGVHVARQFDLQRANAAYAQAVELSSDPRSIHLARSFVSEALAVRPKQQKWYMLRGLLNRRLGEHQLALYDSNAAVRLDPTNPAAFCGRGLCLRKLGRPRDALADIDRAIDLSQQPKYRFYRALVVSDLQRWGEAAEDYLAASKGGAR